MIKDGYQNLELKQHYVVILFENHFDGTLTCNRVNGVSVLTTLGLQCQLLHYVTLRSQTGNLSRQLLYGTMSHSNTTIQQASYKKMQRVYNVQFKFFGRSYLSQYRYHGRDC